MVLACAVHTPSELQVAVSEGGHTGSGWWMSMVRSFALYSPVWKLILHILTQCCYPVLLPSGPGSRVERQQPGRSEVSPEAQQHSLSPTAHMHTRP